MTQLRLFLVALRQFSRWPVGARLARWLGHDPAWLAPATRYFPLVGLLVASLTAVIYAAGALLLPHAIAVLLAVAAGLIMTGASHETGLAVHVDSTLVRDDREGAPGNPGAPTTAMRGIAALVLLLLGRFETLSSIDPSWIGVTLVTAAGLSRGCSVAIMLTLPRAQRAGSGVDGMAGAEPGLRDAGIALAIAAIPVVLAALWTGQAAVFASASGCAVLSTAWLRRRCRLRTGGYTREGLDATQQLSELVFLLGALAMLVGGGDPGVADSPPPDSVD